MARWCAHYHKPTPPGRLLCVLAGLIWVVMFYCVGTGLCRGHMMRPSPAAGQAERGV